MIDAVRAYLAMLKEPPSSEREALRALARALDQLSLAYHDTTPVEVDEGNDPPSLATYDEMRAMAVRAFPDFGFYAVTQPHEVPPGEGSLADSIDDLADVALEMLKVEWHWLNTSPADAMWEFRWGYRSHWGRHLHNLRGYVHSLQFEGTAPIETVVEWLTS